jgi:hypothetical protein
MSPHDNNHDNNHKNNASMATQLASPERHDSFNQQPPFVMRCDGDTMTKTQFSDYMNNYLFHRHHNPHSISRAVFEETLWMVSQRYPGHEMLVGLPVLPAPAQAISEVRDWWNDILHARFQEQQQQQQQQFLFNTTAPGDAQTAQLQAFGNMPITQTATVAAGRSATPGFQIINAADWTPSMSTSSASIDRRSVTPAPLSENMQASSPQMGMFAPPVSRAIAAPRQHRQALSVSEHRRQVAAQAAASRAHQYQPGMVAPSPQDMLVEHYLKKLEQQNPAKGVEARGWQLHLQDNTAKELFIQSYQNAERELCRGNMGPPLCPASAMRQQNRGPVIDLTGIPDMTFTTPGPAPAGSNKYRRTSASVEESVPKRKATEEPASKAKATEEPATTTTPALGPTSVNVKKRKQASSPTEEPTPKRKITTERPSTVHSKRRAAPTVRVGEYEDLFSTPDSVAPINPSTSAPKIRLSDMPMIIDLTGPEPIETSNSGFKVHDVLEQQREVPLLPNHKKHENALANGVSLKAMDYCVCGLDDTMSEMELHHVNLLFEQRSLNPASGAPVVAVVKKNAAASVASTESSDLLQSDNVVRRPEQRSLDPAPGAPVTAVMTKTAAAPMTSSIKSSDLPQSDNVVPGPDGEPWTEAGAQLEWEIAHIMWARV